MREYKLGNTVLLEIVRLVQNGMTENTDVSQSLRDIRMELDDEDSSDLQLTKKYSEESGWA